MSFAIFSKDVDCDTEMYPKESIVKALRRLADIIERGRLID